MNPQLLTISELINAHLFFLEKFKVKRKGTRKAKRVRLTSRIGRKITVSELFEEVGMLNTGEITREKIQVFYEKLTELIPNDDYRSTISCAVRKMLEWAMDDKLIPDDKLLLTLLPQKQSFHGSLQAPTKKQLEVLEQNPMCKNEFLSFMMFFVIGILMIRLDLRPGEEICKLNVNDIDFKEKVLWVERKRGRRIPVHFGSDLVKIFRLYRWMRYLYLKKFGAENETALIIKQSGRAYGLAQEGSWRLTTAGLMARFRNFAKRHSGIFNGMKLYGFRKLSVSMKCKVGRLIGMAIEDLAFVCDHNREVFNNFYNIFANDKSDLLSKDLEENIEDTLQMAANSKTKYENHPDQIQHIAAYKRFLDKVGDMQIELERDRARYGEENIRTFGFHAFLKKGSKSNDEIRRLIGLPQKNIRVEAKKYPTLATPDRSPGALPFITNMPTAVVFEGMSYL